MTQSGFKKAGVTKQLLFRGVKGTGHDQIVTKMLEAEKKGNVKVLLNPASSWSSSKAKALNDFAGTSGICFEKEVPVHHIFVSHLMKIPNSIISTDKPDTTKEHKIFNNYTDPEKEYIVIGFESKPVEKINLGKKGTTKIAANPAGPTVVEIQPNLLLPDGYGEYILGYDNQMYWRTNKICTPVFQIDSQELVEKKAHQAA